MKTVESICSIDLAKDFLSWIHVDNSGLVLDWNISQFKQSLDENLYFEQNYDLVNNSVTYY
jgi:hypothetical protein